MSNIIGRLSGNISITGSGIRNGDCTLTVEYELYVVHDDSSMDFELTEGTQTLTLTGKIASDGMIKDSNGNTGITFDINVSKLHNGYNFNLSSKYKVQSKSSNVEEIELELIENSLRFTAE